jgi:hypothetical protein
MNKYIFLGMLQELLAVLVGAAVALIIIYFIH